MLFYKPLCKIQIPMVVAMMQHDPARGFFRVKRRHIDNTVVQLSIFNLDSSSSVVVRRIIRIASSTPNCGNLYRFHQIWFWKAAFNQLPFSCVRSRIRPLWQYLARSLFLRP